MPCRWSIDHRGPVGRVLRDVRRDVEVAQSPLLAPLLTSREISRSIPHRTPGAGVFRSRIVPRAAVARRHGAAMTASSSDASRTCVALAPKPKDLAPRRTSSPLCPARESRPVASPRVMLCACAGQRQMARAAVIETMEANGRRNSLHPNRVQATYRVEVLANSTLGHCGQRALTVPRTWMIAPSVITPRDANKLKKAKQPSGTASASNKSRFLAKYVCLRLLRPAEF
jgi:hypothetical protein